ncbi:MAG: hypothetical protein K2L70_01765 [Clostridia bacterium]|nr:hypothetical protein [Clostridia bacterium]
MGEPLDLLYQKLNTASSAMQAMRIQEEIDRETRKTEAQARSNAKKDAILLQGAQTNIAQKELLEEQLKAVKEQNEQLKEQCSLLKELYETEKKQSEDNAKVTQKSEQDVKHSKIFGWVSFVVAALISIAGVLVGILV